MSDKKPPGDKAPAAEPDKGKDEDLTQALSDPKTVAFLKDYLAISDDALKAHVRRLVEEIRLNPKKKPKPKT